MPIPTTTTPSAATTVPPSEAVTVAAALELAEVADIPVVVAGEAKSFIGIVVKGIKARGFPFVEEFEGFAAVVREIEDDDVTGFHVVEAFEEFDDKVKVV